MSAELGEDSTLDKFTTNGTRRAGDAGQRKFGEDVLRLQSSSAPIVNAPPLIRRAANLKGPADGDLFICAGVKVKGEIASCNVITVEGEVEGRVQARQLIVASSGSFSGRAHVEQADIAGRFEGCLEVPGKLLVRGSGRLDCQVSYGQLEIETGGELSGLMAKSSQKRPGFLKTWVRTTGIWRS